MSDALTYLVKARPEAMGHYFSFLKDAGKHLDPKTRDLISVITKVHAQTERGLRQYLKRALRDGCTAAEVLDALLMAFPEFQIAAIGGSAEVVAGASPSDWHDVMAAVDLAPGGVARVDCDGRGLFVHHGADGWKVFDSRCPHQTTDIPHLALTGTRLTCPKHEWVFDIQTGQCIEKGDSPLKRWQCKVLDGRLLARW
jgi:nitrite reductase/ring-hydroxylating ferredoxin subunit/alkylhydroperoxidase/carboxymuconolactone decarboxylase family protein YurZ